MALNCFLGDIYQVKDEYLLKNNNNNNINNKADYNLL